MRLLTGSILLLLPFLSEAQLWQKPKLTGFYAQWGYNRDKFSRSTLHFSKDGAYDFTLHDMKAVDKPDFSGFRTSPLDITIPQNSLRIGAYLNEEKTWAIEINFDHAKYVIVNNQRARLTGSIYGEKLDTDTIISPYFLKFEHTNGANFWNINFVRQKNLLHSKKRLLATAIGKVGAGVVIPRSDVTLFGKQLDNKYHVAGYMFNTEGGFRFYPLRNFFMEATGKVGYANYTNVLTVEGGRAHHDFFFAEVIGLVGYEIHLKPNTKRVKSPD